MDSSYLNTDNRTVYINVTSLAPHGPIGRLNRFRIAVQLVHVSPREVIVKNAFDTWTVPQAHLTELDGSPFAGAKRA